MIQATESTFDQMVKTAGTVLVVFSSSTCGPCQAMRKTLESISSIALLQVDVMRCPALTKKFAITSVPTLILIRNGKTVGRASGSMSQLAVERFIS